MEEVLQFQQQHLFLVLALQLIFGLIFGSIPLLLGRRRGMATLGWVGFAVTVLVSLVIGLLSIISAAIFSVIILLKGKGSPASDGD